MSKIIAKNYWSANFSQRKQ